MKNLGIIIVDDDRKYLHLMEKLFMYKGINVICVDNGADALREMKERPIRLIFTDLHMSGMNGLELARETKKLKPDSKIVMLTNDPSPETSALATEAGISKVFVKPFNLAEILPIVREEEDRL